MSRKKLSLGEKIALAASGSQEDEFPEDIEYYDTSAKVVDLDEDYDTIKPAVRSTLRSKNAQLLDEFDEKYSGQKVSRKTLQDEDRLSEDDEEMIEDEEDSFKDDRESDDLYDSKPSSGEEVSDEEEEDDSGDKSKDNEGEFDEEESGDDEEEEESDVEEEEEESDVDEEEESDLEERQAVQTLSLKDKEAEVEKGKATLNQLRIWDSLLEVRIRLQKMLLDCNRLPQTEMYEEVISDIMAKDKASTLPQIIQTSQEATKTLMSELMRLQKIMTEKNTETQKAVLKNHSSDDSVDANDMSEEITSDQEDKNVKLSNNMKKEKFSPSRKRRMNACIASDQAKSMKLEDLESAAAASFSSFVPYRNQTIQKWNDKTQFAGGKFNRKTANQQISTLKQIEQILSNRERLIKRTQIKRSNYSVIGEPDIKDEASATELDQETNPEIFDDDDFYHQLLRELIERKTSNVNDPVQLSHHWLELQKLRTKLKRKVDTKASKGRKIRYDVHAKLVNFMAPYDNSNMSSAAVKELFGSLFGKTRQSE